MKINLIIVSILTLTFIVSCQKNSQNNNPQSVPNETGNSNKDTKNDTYSGPSDGGGGDTCNGKMIESYKVDITSLDEFKDLVLPLFDKLKPKNNKDKKSPFLLTPENKTWYLIDCKLNDLPKNRKGLYLESYQTAIQTSREVFIENSSYQKMPKEEKAKLIIHETIMGLYLMKYMTLEELCKLSDSCNIEHSKASKWKMFRPEKYTPLNEEDHQKIRNVTAWIWAEKEHLTVESFWKLLRKNDFDQRFNFSNNSDTENTSKEIEIEVSVFIRMIKKYQWSHQFPEFCSFDKINVLSHSKCKTEMTVDSLSMENIPIYENSYSEKTSQPDKTEIKTTLMPVRHLSLNIKITRESDQKIFDANFKYPLIGGENQKIKLFGNQIGNIVNVAPFILLSHWPTQAKKETVVEGFKSQALFLLLNVTDLENPKIYSMNFQNYIWYDFEEKITALNGLKFKEIYGYPVFLETESETLFDENEMIFNFDPVFKTKQFIRQESISN
jgi:hypothetical protein